MFLKKILSRFDATFLFSFWAWLVLFLLLGSSSCLDVLLVSISSSLDYFFFITVFYRIFEQ